jgi:hypothetical protein
VPFTAVHLNDRFWAPRIQTNRTETIPFAFQQCELSGRVENFIRAAKALRRERLDDTSPPGYPFDDTDLYKVIEGASYTLSVQPDPNLDAYVDSLIEKIAAAQEPDGYLYTTRTINPEHPHPWKGPLQPRDVLARDDERRPARGDGAAGVLDRRPGVEGQGLSSETGKYFSASSASTSFLLFS